MVFQDFQPLVAIATTVAAVQRLQPLWESGAVVLWVPEAIAAPLQDVVRPTPVAQPLQLYRGSLRAQVAELWGQQRGLIFCLATGAVVRLIAPLLHDKSSDPAVVVVDEAGAFVISLCGGHQGGADALTRAVALQLGAAPVLTGAANRLGLPAIDTLGLPFGWRRGLGNWTGVSAAIARQAPVQVVQEAGSTLWQAHLPDDHGFQFDALASDAEARVWIGPSHRCLTPDADFPEVQWHPRVLWLGIGCERGTARSLIEFAVQQVCRAHQLATAAIAGVGTIDLKADEVGLVELCGDRQWRLVCFSAASLRTVAVPSPSPVVEAEVGTPSVAEAAALLAAGQHRLVVPKQIIRHPDYPGAVTIAVAQADREYTGRAGRLWLVGIGPGDLTQITPAAQTAIAQADAVVGYQLYVDLTAALRRPGQVVEALPITQERQRAERAIELAHWGLTVAVISSGDCGIYGMAGLVLEQLQAHGWDGKTPQVQVFPGITALQAAASRVGTPLMHDFCAISLSDLLTPWEVIERRLTAAAQADFVTALYNPRSQTRTQPLTLAQQIFLAHRDPQTPVAIVRAAYRPDEQITLTTLAQLLDQPIDMLTTVLIGNRSTRIHHDWMITPRGYAV